MARCALLLLLVLASVALCAAKFNGVQRCDVGIIGGGAAGSAAAVFLKDRNKTVCLFERDSTLGGHCDTFNITGAPAGAPYWHDLGVSVYTNTTFMNASGFGQWKLGTDKYFARFLPASAIVPIDFSDSTASTPVFPADLQHGLPLPNPPPTPAEQAAIGAAVTRLATIVATRYPWLSQAGFYPDPIPAELLGTFSAFIRDNDLTPLEGTLFAQLLFNGGMGSFDKLTALYALQNLHLGIIALFQPTKGGIVIQGGCGRLYDAIRAYLGSSVYLNSQVIVAARPLQGASGPITIVVRNVSDPRDVDTFQVGSLIVAIPQTIENLVKIGLDFEEYSAFAAVDTRDYFAIEFNVAGPLAANGSFQVANRDVVNANTLPTPPTLLSVQRDLPYGPANGWASSDNYITDAAMLAVVNDRLSKMPASYLTSVSVTRFIRHVFQPHFPVSALAASPNPYNTIASLQGRRNTYYIGALMSFAETAKVLETTYRLIDQRF